MGQKGGTTLTQPRCRGQQRTVGLAGRPPAVVIAFAEMWAYCQARHGAKRQDWCLGTAIAEETDGRRRTDFAVGDRSANALQQLYAGLPAAELYRTDAYAACGSRMLPASYVVGKGGAVNWNEGHANL